MRLVRESRNMYASTRRAAPRRPNNLCRLSRLCPVSCPILCLVLPLLCLSRPVRLQLPRAPVTRNPLAALKLREWHSENREIMRDRFFSHYRTQRPDQLGFSSRSTKLQIVSRERERERLLRIVDDPARDDTLKSGITPQRRYETRGTTTYESILKSEVYWTAARPRTSRTPRTPRRRRRRSRAPHRTPPHTTAHSDDQRLRTPFTRSAGCSGK